MNIKQIDKLIIAFLILAILSLNYPALDNFLEGIFSAKEEVLVERVIDGDTIEAESGSVRLLGINTPERGEIYYEQAKAFLESRIFNKTVSLEFGKDKRDKYNRTLAYVFLDDKNINIEMVEAGFANYYFYEGRDKYSDDLEDAWKKCMENKINLCEKSDNICAQCITINSDFLISNCPFSCGIKNWTVKGEGRDKFVFNQTLTPNQQVSFELDLTDTGQSLFLRDEKGRLAGWKKNIN